MDSSISTTNQLNVSGKTTLLDLPTEILDNIFSYLVRYFPYYQASATPYTNSLLNCTLVCRRLHPIALSVLYSNLMVIVSSVEERRFDCLGTQPFINLVQRFKNDPLLARRALRVVFFVQSNSCHVPREEPFRDHSELLRLLPSMEELYLCPPFPADYSKLDWKLPNTVRMNFGGYSHIYGEFGMLETEVLVNISIIPSVRKLWISYHDFDVRFHPQKLCHVRNSNVTDLRFSECSIDMDNVNTTVIGRKEPLLLLGLLLSKTNELRCLWLELSGLGKSRTNLDLNFVLGHLVSQVATLEELSLTANDGFQFISRTHDLALPSDVCVLSAFTHLKRLALPFSVLHDCNISNVLPSQIEDLQLQHPDVKLKAPDRKGEKSSIPHCTRHFAAIVLLARDYDLKQRWPRFRRLVWWHCLEKGDSPSGTRFSSEAVKEFEGLREELMEKEVRFEWCHPRLFEDTPFGELPYGKAPYGLVEPENESVYRVKERQRRLDNMGY